MWISAHIGISGNEKPDEVTKEATDNNPSNILIPHTDFYAYFEKIYKKKSNEKMKKEGETKVKLYFQEYYKDSTKPWFIDSSLPRNLITTVNRLRSGHYNLNASLYQIKITNNSACTCGYDTQDINHIVWQCDLYEGRRRQLYIKLSKYRKFPPFDIKIFLCEPNSIFIKKIFNFLQNCNLNV